MWPSTTTLLEIAFRTAVIYLVVLIGLRLTGKREVGQMSPFDLVLLLLIANAVQNAMTGPDTSIGGGLVAATTLLAINALVTAIVGRSRKAREFVEGTPTLLIRNGRILRQNLAQERVTEDELHQALREHGVARVEDVSLAVLEIDGNISVLKTDEMPASPQPHHRIRFMRRKSS